MKTSGTCKAAAKVGLRGHLSGISVVTSLVGKDSAPQDPDSDEDEDEEDEEEEDAPPAASQSLQGKKGSPAQVPVSKSKASGLGVPPRACHV
jgi:hypothetical protein